MGAVFYAAPTRNDKNWVRELLNLAPKYLGFDEIILWATNLPVPLAPSVLLRQTNNHLRLILFTQTPHPKNCFFILILHPVVIVVFLLQWFELALGFVDYIVIILWHCFDLTWSEVILFCLTSAFFSTWSLGFLLLFYIFCTVYLGLFLPFLFFGTVLTWQFG